MRFEIKGRYWKDSKTFPSLNDYIHELGRNPKTGGKMKQKYEKIACDALRTSCRGKKITNLVTLHYVFYEPSSGQKRDHMNVFSFADKVIQDALQKCGILPDDSPVYVDGSKITHEFFYTAGIPRIEVEIEAVRKEDA